MEFLDDPRLKTELSEHPYPLLFATISGAHLYGFASPDSDFDLRGVHVLPIQEVIGLEPGRETIESSHMREELEIDLVTHDAKKFFGLLLKKNGYVMEQVFSPLVLHAGPEFAELKDIARECLTRHHSHHYFGFAESQWRLFSKERPRRVKPLLYVYRVLLTGIHLMRSGEIEANLVALNRDFQLPWVDDLVARKMAGSEHQILDDGDVDFHHDQFQHLRGKLEDSYTHSPLPEKPSGAKRLDDLLVRIRMATLK
jgi:uncharacterized protein